MWKRREGCGIGWNTLAFVWQSNYFAFCLFCYIVEPVFSPLVHNSGISTQTYPFFQIITTIFNLLEKKRSIICCGKNEGRMLPGLSIFKATDKETRDLIGTLLFQATDKETRGRGDKGKADLGLRIAECGINF